jgi:hypothetical protein
MQVQLIQETDNYVWFSYFDKSIAAKAYSRGFTFAERFNDTKDIMYLRHMPKKSGRFKRTSLYEVTSAGVLLDVR